MFGFFFFIRKFLYTFFLQKVVGYRYYSLPCNKNKNVLWCELDRDVLGEVMSRLCAVDQARFRAVCKAFRAVHPIKTPKSLPTVDYTLPTPILIADHSLLHQLKVKIQHPTPPRIETLRKHWESQFKILTLFDPKISRWSSFNLWVDRWVLKAEYEPLPVLEEDIVRFEILTRLPVKSLVRFRCVCKEWQFLLSRDTNFIKAHLSRTSKDPKKESILAKCHHPWNRFGEEGTHPLQKQDMYIAGSIDGLVCIYVWVDRWSNPAPELGEIGIWNPATNQYKCLPPPSPLPVSDVDKFSFTFGFGFDPIANDYKIVYINEMFNRPLVGRVYSCNEGSWSTNCVYSTFISHGYLSGYATVVNGRPYWFCFSRDDHKQRNLLSFDMGDEVFKLLPSLDYVDKYIVLVNLRDSLAGMILDGARQTVDVYVLDESGWSKNYIVCSITIRYMDLFQCFRCRDLLFTDYNKQFKLVCIDPETHGVNGISSGTSPLDTYSYYSFQYIESLVSITGMNQIQINTDECDILFVNRSY